MAEKAKFKKSQCPECGSMDTKAMLLPYGDEEDEYIYCNKCKKVSVITKVSIVVKETKS